MIRELSSSYNVIKAFNNNVVSVEFDGKESILFGKGIGFGKKTGDRIDKGTEFEKIFFIEDEQNIKNFNELVSRNDDKFVGLCEELICEISNELKEELSENIHIGLIDHVSIAIKRLAEGEVIENPFLVEIETLYAQEFGLAKEMAVKLEIETGVFIPDGEVGLIALHIHSARNNGKLSNTIKYAYIGNSVVETVEDLMEIEIDRKSLDYARFLTHLRFAMERILKNVKIENDFLDLIKIKYRKSYKVAKEVAKIMEESLDKKVNNDEIAYIAMHIQRFLKSYNNRA
ncbi:PRD domain-containing protein [uncultured Clostridium sp.]|jgi:transcriptional antiterminator|uniref:PRD domain-containing protein n=1 Tax=uncultured Clostridium sp. TaxID=59620 RepID=UPI002626E311|nr:PRD domain-containing protein [uncultured Clostridium sp.]